VDKRTTTALTLRQHSINDTDCFIAGWYIDTTVCDSLLDYFANSEDKHVGTSGADRSIDASIKDSIDCYIRSQKLMNEYCKELQGCVNAYIEKYPYCNTGAAWRIVNTDEPRIQYYPPGGGYHQYHCERTSQKTFGGRHLVFMTYLNDVTDEGETEFYHQKLKVRPEKGLTLIWPTDWPFTHRGVTSKTQEKYIITGWFNYID
jgi:hypothetical protein